MEYRSVEEAKAVYDKQENIMLDGRTLHINFSLRFQKESKSNNYLKAVT